MYRIENFLTKFSLLRVLFQTLALLIFPAIVYYTDISQAKPGKSIWGWVPYFIGLSSKLGHIRNCFSLFWFLSFWLALFNELFSFSLNDFE